MLLVSAIAALVRGSEQCQGHGNSTIKPRRVSAVCHPLAIESAPATPMPVEPTSAPIEPLPASGEPPSVPIGVCTCIK
jgi:hypothetical protein